MGEGGKGMKDIGNRWPAFPTIQQDLNDREERVFFTEPGMSKRFFAACMAIQGLMVGHTINKRSEIVKTAYLIADELLKQEEQE